MYSRTYWALVISRVGNPDIGIGIFSGLDPTFPDRNFGIGNFSGFTPDLQNGSGSGPDRESRRDPDEISGLTYFARFTIKQLLSDWSIMPQSN